MLFLYLPWGLPESDTIPYHTIYLKIYKQSKVIFFFNLNFDFSDIGVYKSNIGNKIKKVEEKIIN